MNTKKLLQSGFIYTLGNLLVQGLAFITLPIYTRVISTEVYGQYSLYVAWMNIIMLFIGLQTSGSLSSARVKYGEEFKSYSGSAFSVGNIWFLIILLIAFLFRSFLAPLVGFSESIFLLMVCQSYASYVVTFFGQYFIQQQRSLANLILSLANAVSSVALSLFLIFHWSDDFLSRVFGAFVPTIITGIVAFAYIYYHSKSFYNPKYFRFIVTVSVPLIFHLLGHQLLGQLDRIMLARLYNTKEVAMYSFGYSLGMIIQIISLIIVSYFLVFLYTFPVNIQFFYANTTWIPIGTLLAAGVNWLLNLVLIPHYAAYGAAMATIISYLALLIFHHIVSKVKYHYSDVSVRQYIILSGIVFSYAMLMNMFLDNIVIRWSLGIIILIVYSIVFQKVILDLLSKKRRRR
ncbi:TPA: oligosaccharide flippase family protein [Streptococcus agalactiae]